MVRAAGAPVVVDSVRTVDQLTECRAVCRDPLHVHLHAEFEVRVDRFVGRSMVDPEESQSLEAAESKEIGEFTVLSAAADMIVDTTEMQKPAVLQLVQAAMH